MATCMRAPCLAGSRPTTVPYQRRAFHVARVPNARVTSCKSGWQELVAAAGDVDAPIGVAVGAAVVVTIAVTLLLPLALKPGQEAADKIFEAKQKNANPLDKKKPAPKSRR
eukprot:jgi/Chrzof1/14537/Cz09g06150.t1